ncbi:4-hydroxy-tetrahydrodipicolinate reductase [Pseudobdellovibrio sp. HCB154]|uniref:4-hydroxy-tetrahydrodipicolinate reductase n=1 Tax=Pseudobdellovibrio sp. HCB154 TaxID=3386277 RepID=UPI0039171ACF
MAIRVGLLGFGRTGSVVAKELVSDSELSLQWVCRKTINPALTYASHALGFDGNFSPFVAFDKLTPEFMKKNPVDVVIDFSSGKATALYNTLADAGVRIVTAISKYTPEEEALIKDASLKTAILSSPNITLGINWLMIASKVLQKIIPLADIEVIEEHFRDKKETSGTALRLANHLDIDPQLHVNSIRVGGVVGKHEVIFGLPNQTIRIVHESINRAAFGTGAAFAGKWLQHKPAGLYSMEQVIHEKFMRKVKELDFETTA